MGYLTINNLTKCFGDFTAVQDINIDLEKGEMVALLGGSGCGKTTILRMIAGFIQPNEGAVVIDGKVMNKIPSYKRNVGIFFQNYALFPHMTVFDNVAFSLKLKKMNKEDIKKKVDDILALVKLVGLSERYPRELSGGQQQRVALARALVMEPNVLLLDEPLSNLDAKLRVEMQVEIKRIQHQLGLTTIIVTHDQEEAVSLADRIIIMNAGHILQTGSPKYVFNHPSTPYVADFMGFANFIDGKVTKNENGKITLETLKGVAVSSIDTESHNLSVGEEATFTIRPENIAVFENEQDGCIKGKVLNLTYKGNMTRIDVEGIFDDCIHVSSYDYEGPNVGEDIYLSLPESKVIIYKKHI
ncbi:Maltose/maltodextrin import ATP-binding protein MalK [bioreactor metagenome]|uniref:Maltose/maltodextrin import ATP-binding protein MalK n=1 Tax=bioreactor metagenome TaxID=1076179 RepID=A0A644Z5G2_9ZZZZ|nr:ABC transporter ATP-binding protein [Candidatus Metalachnospira sp.]